MLSTKNGRSGRIRTPDAEATISVPLCSSAELPSDMVGGVGVEPTVFLNVTGLRPAAFATRHTHR